jgi:hypothetical protein
MKALFFYLRAKKNTNFLNRNKIVSVNKAEMGMDMDGDISPAAKISLFRRVSFDVRRPLTTIPDM